MIMNSVIKRDGSGEYPWLDKWTLVASGLSDTDAEAAANTQSGTVWIVTDHEANRVVGTDEYPVGIQVK